MSKTEKTVGMVGGVAFLLAMVFGVANSYSDKPTKEETKTIARQEISNALDTFKLRNWYEAKWLKRGMDSAFNAVNGRIDNLDAGQNKILRLLEAE